jgi:hypothetical protein
VVKLSARRPARTAAVATAVAGCVLALAGCGSILAGSSSPSSGSPTISAPATSPAAAASSSSPGTAVATASPAAAGFSVLSMTFVSDTRGFALGSQSCGVRHCVELLGTSDGGANWQPLTAPTRTAGGVYSTCPDGSPCVQQIRFATPLIGYAYDPSLLITTDGGRSWHQTGGTDVNALEAASGTAVRIVSGGTGCAGQPYQVQSAPIGTVQWRTLSAPKIEMICPPVLYRQGGRLAVVGYGNPAGGVRATAQIDRSSNGGRTWLSGPDSCGGKDGYASGVALAPPDALVLLCQHQMPEPSGHFGPAWVRVSTNGGATFGPDEVIPSLPAVSIGTVVRYQIAAGTSGRLLVSETGATASRLLRTGNGGQTWSTVLSMPAAAPVVLVGFEDPLTGRVAQANTVWTTTNGGLTWVPDAFTG